MLHGRLLAGLAAWAIERAALASDFASPLANMSTEGLAYINADITLHLARLPEGEWIGLATADRTVADGVSVAACPVHEHRGPLGTAAVAAVATPHMPPPPPSLRRAPTTGSGVG